MATNSDVYCPDALDQCGFDRKYRCSFGAIVEKDSPGKSFGFDNRLLSVECIDADQVETDKSGSNEKTMDLIMGLADFDDVRQEYRRMYLLPVELKLNCSSFNLKLSDLRGKDEHTRLSFNGNFAQRSVFVFTEKVVGQAINNLNRWKRGTESNDIKHWLMIAPNQLNGLVKFRADFPYVPQTDFEAIYNRIDSFIEAHDIDGCYNYIANEVFAIVIRYGNEQFNRREVDYLASKLKTKMDGVYNGLDEIEKGYLMIAVDSILKFSASKL